MSRHRFVRNLNINDELAVDELSDEDQEEPEPDMTDEQKGAECTTILNWPVSDANDPAQLESASMSVREVLGPESDNGIADQQIRDAVWEFFFDVEQSTSYLLEEYAKRKAAQDRKVSTFMQQESSGDDLLSSENVGRSSASSPKKSKLSALVSSRLKSVGFGGKKTDKRPSQPSPLSPQEISVQPFYPNGDIFSGESGNRLDDSKPLPSVPFLGIVAPEPVAFDSDKYREDVIAIPRLSTITEQDEVSLRLNTKPSKLGELSSVRGSSKKLSVAAPSVKSTKSVGATSASTGYRPLIEERMPKSPPMESGETSSTSSDFTGISFTSSSPKAPALSQPSGMTASISDNGRTVPVESALGDTPVIGTVTPTPKSSVVSASGSKLRGLARPHTSTTMSSLGSVQSRSSPIPKVIPIISPSSTSSEVGGTSTHSGQPEPSSSASSSVAIPVIPRASSKLAQLAQSRVRHNKLPSIPKSSTTIYTGAVIPSGVTSSRTSSVTTAITTSVQTLETLVALPSSYPKTKSKLYQRADKSRKGAAFPQVISEEVSVEELPMFSPKFAASTPWSSIRQASPSAFATLLAANEVAMSSPPRPSRALHQSVSSVADAIPSISRGFAFNVPSPDDVVANARRGTALRQSSNARR